MKDDRKEFEKEKYARIRAQGRNKRLVYRADAFLIEASRAKYVYNFNWLGVPIFQHPEDIVALQEIIFRVRPVVIVDVGVARGGSAIFYASLLKLLGSGTVIGVDIDIRPHNRDTIEKHPLGKSVKLIEGSSIDEAIFAKIKKTIAGKRPVLVTLDSLHTEGHVFRELELYSTLVTKGSYIVALDTVLKKLPRSTYPKDHANRPWDQHNNAGTAVQKFLKTHRNFAADADIDSQLLVSAAPGGYLKRVS